MLNTGESPNDAKESFLSQILDDTPHPKYYLSKTACLGILRRAKSRDKELPAQLKKALEIQAGITGIEGQIPENLFAEIKSYHINQRNEGIDLNGISGALMATQNMQMQTFIAKPLICLNDQGGERMDVTEEITSTLRSKMGGHLPIIMEDWTRNTEYYAGQYTNESDTGDTQPLLFDNHAKDCRYDGPLNVAPTVSAIYGTGGNNVPLVSKHMREESYCIASNIINRQDKNGGNGAGVQKDISYTLTTCDVHAICSTMKSEEKMVYGQSSFADYKEGCSTIRAEGGDNGGGSENLAVIRNLVRRLTPLECERLQGFPDGWTDIPKASDSPRYRALGNSVAIPCVDFIMRGIAYFLRKNNR